MRTIDISNIDPSLAADVEGGTTGYTLHEQADSKSCGDWQILWHADAGRAGLVYVGSGSDGRTYWTDATSPEDAYGRLQRDNLSP